MLSLPSKPWKKVKVEQEEDGPYTVTFLSPLKDEAEFKSIIHEDLERCLGEHDSLMNPRWDTRSITLNTRDFDSFKRKLIFACILIETG
jgi:hypothetical protein